MQVAGAQVSCFQNAKLHPNIMRNVYKKNFQEDVANVESAWEIEKLEWTDLSFSINQNCIVFAHRAALDVIVRLVPIGKKGLHAGECMEFHMSE